MIRLAREPRLRPRLIDSPADPSRRLTDAGLQRPVIRDAQRYHPSLRAVRMRSRANEQAKKWAPLIEITMV